LLASSSSKRMLGVIAAVVDQRVYVPPTHRGALTRR
jgi:hypothetical protein